MITTNWADDGGQLLVHADDPAGPWSEPVRIPSAMGIDPDLAWDDDGTCLMSYAGFGPEGGEGIVQSPIDPLTGEVLAERRSLWAGTGGKFPEGPHLYRIGDWWYLLIAEGGTERGHAVTIARSRSPQGPFESNPRNPLITHRGTDEPVQNTGHADLVSGPTAAGRSSTTACAPGARARSGTCSAARRSPTRWSGRTAGRCSPGTSSRRSRPTEPSPRRSTAGCLRPGWVPRGSPSEFVTAEDGALRVAGDGEQVFVGRRQEHLHARVRARLDVQGIGGLSVRIDPTHAVELEVAGRPGARRLGRRRRPARAGGVGPARRRASWRSGCCRM